MGDAAATVLAHQCARDDYEYVRVGERWYLVTWAEKARRAPPAGGRQTVDWLVQARPAVAAHCCGQALDSATPARRVYPSAWVRAAIDALEGRS